MLNPLEITDFSKFETGLRPLFELLKNASDEAKLNELIKKDDTFTRLDVETVAAINLFIGTDIKYDEKEEVVNMCIQAFRNGHGSSANFSPLKYAFTGSANLDR